MTSVRLALLAFAVTSLPLTVLARNPPSPNAQMPAISLSSDVVNFGPELVGRTSPSRQIVITNSGDAPLQVMGLALMGGDAMQFAPANVPAKFPVSIDPSAALTITYTFKPASDGDKKTTLSITSNDPTKPEATVLLAGTGIANPITVAPAKIDFGVFYQGAPVDAVTVKVANVSSWPIDVQGPVIAGMDPDRFSIDMVVGTLMPGQAFTAHVLYKTDKLGQHHGTITFTLADPALTPPVLTLTGETVTGFIKLDPPSLDFGPTLVGDAPVLTVKITNITSGPLKLATIRSDDGRFSVDYGGLLINRLEAGATGMFSVAFTPSAMGPATGNVVIAREGSTKADGTVPLKGEGAPPIIEGRGVACHVAGRAGSSWAALVPVGLALFVLGIRARRRTRA